LARFQQVKLTQLYIPTISVFELYYGIEKNNSHQRNLNALESFIAPLTVVDFTIDAAKKAAIIRSDLEKQGKPIGAYDIQIAAMALAFDMVLLTNNIREFERVKNLKLENWTI
jgi:tRNA(fMet)-specific endonuclease VapC